MNKENKKKLNKKLVLKSFWRVAKKYKISFFVVIIGTVIVAGLGVYIPLQYLKLWNILSANDFSSFAAARSLVLWILILNFLRWITRRTTGFTLSYFESSAMAGLREQSFGYLIYHSHTFFANNFGGSLTQKISRYARAFEKLTDRLVIDALPLLVTTGGTVFAIYTMFPKYALILSIFCVIFLITTFVYIRFKLKYDILSAEADSKTTGAIADSIGNHASVQLFSGQEHEKELVGEVVQKQRKTTFTNWCLWEGLGAISSFYSLGIEFLIFWLVIKDWSLGLITLPVIVLFQSYLIRLIETLWGFGNIIRTFYESFADAKEMADILNTPHEIQDKSTKKLEKVNGDITFNAVTYSYENNKNKLLDRFSINIKPGQKVAIIGSSGAGKTTFVRLLMRLFDIKNGSIMIDGIDIRDVSQADLRNHISFVPQEPILFHRTLLENIRYGRRDATDEEVKEAAHLAHCDKFIDLLPEGYQTYVGERGIKLSGGERQRVAIARAILKNAPILVLDEATSSLDSESEALIQDALQKLIKGKTTIVIAHRLSTIRQMDRIVVIEKGEIVEDGTHEELTQKDSGIYKKLWELQAKGFKKNI
ncbi:MAG TPA: ABC transporter ATP-binding protein [Candidatus Paceibacterota bacterium]|nr:ABC transporter ATP-binding protein [Candidatus Paceibacterota bacterium]